MVMMPNTARKLRESKANRIEDLMAVAAHFNVTHLVIFTTTKVGTYMKLAKLPQGPTLTFRVASFSLIREVKASQRKPRGGPFDYMAAPLQVMNGFGMRDLQEAVHRKLVSEMLRGMFPPIDVPTFKQAECRRAALFHYDKEKDAVHFRHYHVGRKPVGLQRGVARLLSSTRVPKMGNRADVADYLTGGGGASESEAEDVMEAPSTSGSGHIGIRLSELGPRLELELIKAEEGVNSGAVLHHRYNVRTPTEQEVLNQKARERRKLRERSKKLEAEASAIKKKKQKIAKDKAARTSAGGEEDDIDSDAREGPEGGGAGEQAAGKRKRFHPFAWGAKASKKASQGGSGTVEIDSRPGKRSRRGGTKHAAKDADQGGAGKLARGKHIVDKFHRSRQT